MGEKIILKDKNIMKFAGVWKNVSDERIEEIKESIKWLRERTSFLNVSLSNDSGINLDYS